MVVPLHVRCADTCATRSLIVGLSLLLLLALGLSPAHALENDLLPTPLMGWNSWYAFYCTYNETYLHENLALMTTLGLRQLGYEFFNLDDCWQVSRNATTQRIQPDLSTLPSGIVDLATRVHAQGLKFGVYSDAGTNTCAGRPGSLGYEQVDAQQYAEWGVDLLKYDNCNNDGTPPATRYPVMRDALNATGRPIVFSMCEWGVDDPATWARPVGNMWRTTDDITADWATIMDRAATNDRWWKYAGPHGWNDPDMLQVGRMADSEAQAQFSLWCLMKAPLLISVDLRTLSAGALAILSNAEAIAVNQDALAVQGHRVWASQPDIPVIEVQDCGQSSAVPATWRYNATNHHLVLSTPSSPSTHTQTPTQNKSKSRRTKPPTPPPPPPQQQQQLCMQVTDCGASGQALVGAVPCVLDPAAPCYRAQQWTVASLTPDTPTAIYSALGAPPPSSSRAGTATSKRTARRHGRGHIRAAGAADPSTLCLDVYNKVGPDVEIYPCVDQDNERFVFNGSTGALVDQYNHKCLAPSATPRRMPAPQEVWAGPLSGGDAAVVLLNTADAAAEISAQFAQLEVASIAASAGAVHVRDLWAHADVGVFADVYTVAVAPHTAVFLRLHPMM